MSRQQSLGLGPEIVKLHRDATMRPQLQVPFLLLSSEKVLLFFLYFIASVWLAPSWSLV